MFPSAAAISKTAISMIADGSCHFNALTDQICHDPNRADEVREAIVNFLAGNRDVFQVLLPLSDIHPNQSDNDPLDRSENAQLDKYLRLLAKTRVCGGEPEIHAAAQHFGVIIMVHQEKGNILRYNDGIGGNAAHFGNIFLVVSFQESHAAQVQVIKHDRSLDEQVCKEWSSAA